MNKKILNEVNTIKKMMGIVNEQYNQSNFRETMGINLPLIKNEEDYKLFTNLTIDPLNLYRSVANPGVGDTVNPKIVQNFMVYMGKFLEFVATQCTEPGDCALSVPGLWNAYYNKNKKFFEEASIDINYPKTLTDQLSKHVRNVIKKLA